MGASGGRVFYVARRQSGVVVLACAWAASACGSTDDSASAPDAGSAGAAPTSSIDSGRGGTIPTSGTVDAGAQGSGDSSEGGLGGDAGELDASAACTMTFPATSNFGAKGTFAITKEDRTTTPSLAAADCTIYRPSTLTTSTLRHPVVAWGNGTGTPTVIVYEWLFNQWASHGFIVAAANTPSAGTGAAILACLDWVEAQSKIAGSPYEGRVVLGHAATSGHSQGGGGALMAGRDARIAATVPFMAYTQGLGYDVAAGTQQHGPMLLMSGSADTIAPPDANQKPVFTVSNVPTFWGILAGSDHVTFALGGQAGFLAPSTAWLRLHLMCDESARPMFYGPTCTLCSDSKWAVQRKGL